MTKEEAEELIILLKLGQEVKFTDSAPKVQTYKIFNIGLCWYAQSSQSWVASAYDIDEEDFHLFLQRSKYYDQRRD